MTVAQPPAPGSAPVAERVELWPVERVHANPLNPRGELDPDTLLGLAASIRQQGILTPLLATPRAGDLLVVAGHRRRAAAALAGVREFPVIVHEFGEREQLEIMLAENLQGEDLTPLQEARAYEAALRGGGTKAGLARRLGVAPERLGSRLDVLKLDAAVQRIFERRDLPISLAAPLLGIEDPAEQRRVASLAMQRALTVAQLDDFIRGRARKGGAAGEHAPAPAAPRRPTVRATGGAGAPGRKAGADVPAELTRSEARALLVGEGVATFVEMERALEYACDGCDEARYPEICRACPLPQFIGAVVKEMSREG